MKKLLSTIILSSLFLTFACSAKAQNKQLSEQERYKLAAEYSEEFRGLSVLVLKKGKVIFEEYQNGHSADKPWLLASGTKSFSGVMLAAAIEDKLIRNFDEKISDTITEWRTNKQKADITLRQLLSLTSGIDAGQIGRVPTYSEAISSPFESVAGTKFEYGPVPFQIFGEVMKRKLAPKKESVMQYLERRILNPIGLKVAFWRKIDGDPLLPQGASLTAREWAKFGEFLRTGGKANGKRIVKKKLLDELVIGSNANPAYGLTFWLNKKGKNPRGQTTIASGDVEEITANGITTGVDDLFMAAGAGKQKLYVIPSMDLVIVRQGQQSRFEDSEFLQRLILGQK